MAYYIHPHLIGSTSILPVPSSRPDLMSIDLFAPGGFFEFSFTRLRITNAYNLSSRRAPYRMLSPPHLFEDLPFPTLVLGDFNLHHPAADPLCSFDAGEARLSHPYFDLASELLFSLLNLPGLYTYFPFTSSSRPSVLDLAFANRHLVPAFASWDTPLPSTGSDHIPIVVTFNSPRFRPPPLSQLGQDRLG